MSVLRPLFSGTAPWASVYLEATRPEENADHRIDPRWRTPAARLTGPPRPPPASPRPPRAELVLVEPEDLALPHGIGAVLRYPDA